MDDDATAARDKKEWVVLQTEAGETAGVFVVTFDTAHVSAQRQANHIIFLHEAHVAEAYSQRGLCKAMLYFLLGSARERGCSHALLKVFLKRDRCFNDAVNVWSALGFWARPCAPITHGTGSGGEGADTSRAPGSLISRLASNRWPVVDEIDDAELREGMYAAELRNPKRAARYKSTLLRGS